MGGVFIGGIGLQGLVGSSAAFLLLKVCDFDFESVVCMFQHENDLRTHGLEMIL